MPEYNVQMFDAVTPKDDPLKIAENKGINVQGFREKYSNFTNCVAAFLSHMSLWEMCSSGTEEYQIFEHDAVCVSPIPKFINYQGCISLGKPSYGKFNTPQVLGVNRLTSKRYFPGAHAYRLKPKAARTLLEATQNYARPTDVFLSMDMFPWLEEYYPWPVVAKDTFSTIQKSQGCTAKHNYGDHYELITV
jgi:GR25 family glycosyltransferase involved in LPS biosynthesis